MHLDDNRVCEVRIILDLSASRACGNGTCDGGTPRGGEPDQLAAAWCDRDGTPPRSCLQARREFLRFLLLRGRAFFDHFIDNFLGTLFVA